MTKEVFTNIKAEEETQLAAFTFLMSLGPLEISEQAKREELSAKVRDMTLQDIGLGDDQMIGSRQGLLAEIATGQYDETLVRAVAIRSLCNEIVKHMLEETRNYYRKRSRKAVQLGEYL